MDFKSLSIEELVRECARNDDGPAWTEFMQRFHRLIAKVVIRVCRECSESSLEVARDLIQAVYAKLVNNDRALLKNFKSQHPNSFVGYLRTLSANEAYDHFRRGHTRKRDVGSTVSINEANLPASAGGTKAVENQILFQQLDEMLRQRDDSAAGRRERLIFWLHYRQGMAAREIAALPGINLSVKGVESVIHRLTEYLRQKMAA